VIELDHIAIAGETLEDAVAHVEASLGVPLDAGGVHVEMGTHNRLLSLGPGIYLEAIAINPDARSPERPRWFDLDRFEGPPRLTNWIARTADLEGALAEAPEGMGVPIAFQRDRFSWSMAVPGTGRLPFDGAAPALIQWDGAVHPADLLEDRGCRLRRLLVQHPEAAALLEAFPVLGKLADVSVEAGPAPRIAAMIETPGGDRVLT
jgi:hypothetical protein